MKSPVWKLAARVAGIAGAAGLSIAIAACTPASEPVSSDIASEPSVEDTARAVHAASLVLDAHADVFVPSTAANFLTDGGRSKVDPALLREGDVGAVVLSIAVGPGPRTEAGDFEARAEADEKLAAALALAAKHADTVQLATTADQVEAVRADGKTALILGFQNARALQGSVDAIDEFYDAGVRVFALNHLGHNDFADSSRPVHDPVANVYEPDAHGGLSELGAAAIKRINDLGAIVDVSQSSKAATLQAVATSRTPVIASHSNVRAISDATRNLSDEEIDRIGETGGVVHVAPFTAYLVNFSTPEKRAAILQARRAAGLSDEYSYPYELYWEMEDPDAREVFTTAIGEALGTATVDLMIDHIDYIVDRIGIDHVGIGTDFNHGSGIEGYDDASDSLNVTIRLIERGYTEEDIRKIWGGNFLRVFREAEAGARSSR